MIQIEEIPVEDIADFWAIHYEYLIRDGIITDDEDKAYFCSDGYRSVIHHHMLREENRHHMVYFLRNGLRVGAAQYCTYKDEGGKCFLMDFWVFPRYRDIGIGHECFKSLQEYTQKDGAVFYEINCTKDNAVRFWKSLGFRENGVDEYGDPLFVADIV